MNTFTNILKRGAVTVLFLMTVTFFAHAQDEGTFSFSGSVDTYFRYNLNADNSPVDYDSDGDGEIDDTYYAAPGSSFANKPGFSLGMVNLIAAYDAEKVGFVGDLVFGPRGSEAVFLSTGSANIVNQLYVYWKVTKKLTLTMGNFNTFLGYEVISPTGNFNYSTSYMFSNGPFSHTGLKADIDLGNGLSLMAAVMNPTDATEFNPTNDYVGGAQLGYTNEKGGAWLNTVFSDGSFQIDLTTGWDVTETVYVGANATSASDSFFGAALYLQNSFTESFALGLRGEYFGDKGLGVLTKDESKDESVIDLTLSANYSIGNLTLIPEIRLDSYSEEDVVISDLPAGETTSSLSSFLLAAVYAF